MFKVSFPSPGNYYVEYLNKMKCNHSYIRYIIPSPTASQYVEHVKNIGILSHFWNLSPSTLQSNRFSIWVIVIDLTWFNPFDLTKQYAQQNMWVNCWNFPPIHPTNQYVQHTNKGQRQGRQNGQRSPVAVGQGSSGVVRGRQGSSGVVRGRQGSSGVVRGRQGSSGVVRGRQGSSGVVRGRQGSSGVVRGRQGSSGVVRGRQGSSGVIRSRQGSSGVVRSRQRSRPSESSGVVS